MRFLLLILLSFNSYSIERTTPNAPVSSVEYNKLVDAVNELVQYPKIMTVNLVAEQGVSSYSSTNYFPIVSVSGDTEIASALTSYTLELQPGDYSFYFIMRHYRSSAAYPRIYNVTGNSVIISGYGHAVDTFASTPLIKQVTFSVPTTIRFENTNNKQYYGSHGTITMLRGN